MGLPWRASVVCHLVGNICTPFVLCIAFLLSSSLSGLRVRCTVPIPDD